MPFGPDGPPAALPTSRRFMPCVATECAFYTLSPTISQTEMEMQEIAMC